MDIIHLAKTLQRTALEVLSDAYGSVNDPLLGVLHYGTDIVGEIDTAIVKLETFDHAGTHKYRIIVIEERF